MEKKIIDTIEVSGGVDNITENDNLNKAIDTMATTGYAKATLKNKIKDNIKNFDINIHEKVSEKIKNHELTSEQEEKLDKIISDLVIKINNLVSNMISSLDEGSFNSDFYDLQLEWITEVTNILDWIKYYEKKKVVSKSESEKLLASNDDKWSWLWNMLMDVTWLKERNKKYDGVYASIWYKQ